MLFEELALAVSHLADLSREELVPGADRGDPFQPDVVEAHVLHDRIAELWRDPWRGPLEPLARGHSAVLADAVLEQIRAARVGGLPELLQEARRRVAPARGGDQLAGAVADGLEDRIPAAKVTLGAVSADPGGDKAGGGAQGVGLGRAPVALAFAVLEADEAPPGAVDEDRHGHDRERVDQLECLALVVGKVAHVAADGLARGKEFCPACKVRSRPEVAEPRVVDIRDLSGRPAGATDRQRNAAVAGHVLEHERPTRGRRLAQHAHQVHHGVVEDRLPKKVLGGSADRVQDRVTVAQVALGDAPLLAGLGVREDDRELAGDVDEYRDLVLAPRPRGGAVEPEDAGQLAVAKERHVHEGDDLALTSRSRIGSSQASFATSSTTIGRPCSRRSA